jgi:hypothetical protein
VNARLEEQFLGPRGQFERMKKWQRRQRLMYWPRRIRRALTPNWTRRWELGRIAERCEPINLRLEVTYLNTLVTLARRERGAEDATSGSGGPSLPPTGAVACRAP